jgi:hypothetical protein
MALRITIRGELTVMRRNHKRILITNSLKQWQSLNRQYQPKPIYAIAIKKTAPRNKS